MNGEELRALRRRADTVSGRPETRLAEVHARIGSARRRRAAEAVAVAGASAAVVALVVGVALLAGPTGQHKDDQPPPPADSHTPAPKAVRKIVYSDDLSPIPHKSDTPLSRVATIQVGDRLVRIDQVVRTVSSWALQVADGGAVYAKDDQTVWMTDGGEPHQIAGQACVDTTQASGLGAGTSGAWAVWFDCSPGSQGADLVVFDTVAGREVARHTIPACRGRDPRWPGYKCSPREVIGEHVYVDRNNPGRALVVDVVSGQIGPATPEALAADIDGHARGLVIGEDRQTGVRTTGVPQVFRVVGRQLVPVRTSDFSEFVPSSAFDTGTGRAVRLRLPSGYRAVNSDPTEVDPPFFALFEWLDDETVALARGNTSTAFGDILVCHLADGHCEVAVKAPRGDATRMVAHTWPPG